MEALLRKGLAQLGLDESGAPSLLRYGELLLEKKQGHEPDGHHGAAGCGDAALS